MTTTPSATPALVWSRAALLAAVVLLLSTVGHVSADGRLPGPFALALLLLATTVVSARFLVRPASAPRLVALLVAGQAAIHGALSALAGHGEAPRAATRSPAFVFDGRQTERTGSYLDQVTAMQRTGGSSDTDPTGAADATAWLSHLLEHLSDQDPAMLLAHTAAVVLVGLWLAVGEQALWTVLTLATTGLLRAVACAVVLAAAGSVALLLERVRRAPVLRELARDAVPLPHLLHHVVAHRGPPALLAA